MSLFDPVIKKIKTSKYFNRQFDKDIEYVFDMSSIPGEPKFISFNDVALNIFHAVEKENIKLRYGISEEMPFPLYERSIYLAYVKYKITDNSSMEMIGKTYSDVTKDIYAKLHDQLFAYLLATSTPIHANRFEEDEKKTNPEFVMTPEIYDDIKKAVSDIIVKIFDLYKHMFVFFHFFTVINNLNVKQFQKDIFNNNVDVLFIDTRTHMKNYLDFFNTKLYVNHEGGLHCDNNIDLNTFIDKIKLSDSKVHVDYDESYKPIFVKNGIKYLPLYQSEDDSHVGGNGLLFPNITKYNKYINKIKNMMNLIKQ